MFLEECKYVKTNVKTNNYINKELKSESDSDSDSFSFILKNKFKNGNKIVTIINKA